MNKKAITICSLIIIILNILMITLVRKNDEEIISNMVAIAITIFVYPLFLTAVSQNKKSMMRVEWLTLLFIATVSFFRFINRIDPLKSSVNGAVMLIVTGFCVFTVFIIISRLIYIHKKKK